MKTSLANFNNSNFDKQAGKFKWFIWMLVNAIVFKPSWIPFMGVKVNLLKLFGAHLGEGLVIKPSVYIKFPWKLKVGNHVWIGENVWIDNLDEVTIGDNVCISQGALLLTGNHDYTLSTFDYKNAPIVLEEGVWVGAKSVVCPGVICKSHSILAVGSIATKELESYTIYQGNPAKEVRKRKFKN
ncbi:WcaF family extracellular polysaccharide biosynthesis acetyltransferase [Wenyingzhuangia aestuarii]|uniref:WcaF family extracellular polysaccharide biosynthesis acetyltransferase n=1 Tax=Wenyingzhuangia aestuarii TaxID=1647582 RepID=UPI00143C6846|nr:WcaF family extracellular polysaccharide biosynthesis acetyltransferase [Wenyingzhuangia aestuarii]NJB83251.1 putative colanic acid biosynthesis acetyltransferase WcaF [Wenyingzhuangia aestuarii]